MFLTNAKIKHLAIEVVHRAVKDLSSDTGSIREDAKQFMWSDSPWFMAAGLDVGVIRTALPKLMQDAEQLRKKRRVKARKKKRIAIFNLK